jgi:hypothetical protein
MATKKKKAKKKVSKRKVTKRKVAKKKAIKRKLIKRKVTRRKPAKKSKAAPARKPKEKVIGIVTHYFPQVRAAVIKLKAPLLLGEKIKIKGHTTDFKQNVTSMQIDRVDITSAKKGQEIGVLADSRVRQHDMVYKA